LTDSGEVLGRNRAAAGQYRVSYELIRFAAKRQARFMGLLTGAGALAASAYHQAADDPSRGRHSCA